MALLEPVVTHQGLKALRDSHINSDSLHVDILSADDFMIVIIALHIINQTVQNYCIQFELLLTKSLTEILSEHARGTSVFHEVLNWQNNNTSSLLQILSRWNHKRSVLH